MTKLTVDLIAYPLKLLITALGCLLLCVSPAHAAIQQTVDPMIFSSEQPLQTLPERQNIALIPLLVSRSNAFIEAPSLQEMLASVADSEITVIYPTLGEPFRSVFNQVVAGIAEHTGRTVSKIAVSNDQQLQQVNELLLDSNTSMVVTLGQEGLDMAKKLDPSLNILVGCVLYPGNTAKDKIVVSSLTPDPMLLFKKLKEMKPQSKRVFTVYNPEHNAWLIRQASRSAKKLGMTLTAYPAGSLREAVGQYQKIIRQSDSSKDALWLLQDPTTVDETSIIPLVLKASWSDDLLIFSSSFSHVKRGILFSLYPNNSALGKQLAGSAMNYLNNNGQFEDNVIPLQEVLMAVNLRTARHLNIDTIHQQNVDLTFPQ